MHNKIAVIFGTRPEIIKMAPIIKELEKRKLNHFIIHSNQHYSENMDKVFIEELKLPRPKYNLGIGSGTHGKQTGRILKKIESVFIKEQPNVILVEGDTNTVFGSALAASKLGIRIGHVEAGLRSYDKSMPEEINRILTDHISDYLYTPTEISKQNLIKEGIDPDKIFVTGNTIVDALFQNIKLIPKADGILHQLNINPNSYFLMTVHRQENTDIKERLFNILSGIDSICQTFQYPLIYPIHPRTRKMIKKYQMKIPEQVKLIEPVGYFEFLALEKSAKLILTDSGGVQEESCILGVPCVTLRDNTERPETIQINANMISGTRPDRILECAAAMLERHAVWENPYGDGKTGKRIVDLIEKCN